jgi:hypothetical protein
METESLWRFVYVRWTELVLVPRWSLVVKQIGAFLLEVMVWALFGYVAGRG